MFYHFKIHKEENKFWAQCLELPGCITQADSLIEFFLTANLKLAYLLMCINSIQYSINIIIILYTI